MAQEQDKIRYYFAHTPLLAHLCQQNGWPDAESLQVETRTLSAHAAICSVSFEEILMEGSGCVAGRATRWGQFEVQVDAAGDVLDARPL